jgi:hypothetical protein
MGDRTIELTITNGHDEVEEARAERLFISDQPFPARTADSFSADAQFDRFMFDAHDDDGNEYVVVVRNEPSEELWVKLWAGDVVDIVIDRGFVMRAIPALPPRRGP